MVCNREGSTPVKKPDAEETNNDVAEKPKRTRMITRIGCEAMIQFKLQPDGSYSVNSFVEGHNHMLASPHSMMFLKENRSMTSIQKNFVAKAARLKMGGVKAYRGWKELSGGYKNVGASENDFKNFVRDLKKYIGDFDGQMFIENFIRKKETCSSFYFDFVVDVEDRLSRVFWADTISIKNYALFGDMSSVDSTFRTNKYNMVFVPFTGVDHHKRCISFGAGLLAHEDVESYTWLFSTFLEAMAGCQPKVLITDQDPAMKIAIQDVFPETTHRLCMWHIMKKLREKVSASLWQDDEFKKRLNCCVWNNTLEPKEFETLWANIMIDFDLVYHPWFLELFEIREHWIPAYYKDVFMGGLMRVTSMSESENSFFDRFVMPHVTLVEFWMCFESAMDAQRHKQSKLNSDNKHSSPPLKTPVELERHASEIYTHIIFKEFQKELCAALYNCGMAEIQKTDNTELYIISDSEKEGRTWKVTYSLVNDDVKCTCCLFQRFGILCRHALWVLKTKNFKNIPDKYIVNRWTKDAMKKPVFDKQGQLIEVSETLNDKKKLTTELWEEVYSCVSIAEEDENDIQMLIDKLKEIKIEMKNNRSVLGSRLDKQKEMERYVGCSIPNVVNIKVPKKSVNKGSGKRIESQVIKAIEKMKKKPRYCKICGKQGHNSRTCTKVVKDSDEEDDAEEDEEEDGEEDEEVDAEEDD